MFFEMCFMGGVPLISSGDFGGGEGDLE